MSINTADIKTFVCTLYKMISWCKPRNCYPQYFHVENVFLSMFCSVYLSALYNRDKRNIRDFSFKKLAPNLICKFSYEYLCLKKIKWLTQWLVILTWYKSVKIKSSDRFINMNWIKSTGHYDKEYFKSPWNERHRQWY